MTPDTQTKLSALRALSEAATAGPLIIVDGYYICDSSNNVIGVCDHRATVDEDKANAAFIAAACNGMRALLPVLGNVIEALKPFSERTQYLSDAEISKGAAALAELTKVIEEAI